MALGSALAAMLAVWMGSGALVPAFGYETGYVLATERGVLRHGCVTQRDITTSWGYGCFNGDGDWFNLNDNAPNGKSVAILWNQPSVGIGGICRLAGGDGSKGDCDGDVGETGDVEYRLARCDVTGTVDCKQKGDYVDKTDKISVPPDA